MDRKVFVKNWLGQVREQLKIIYDGPFDNDWCEDAGVELQCRLMALVAAVKACNDGTRIDYSYDMAEIIRAAERCLAKKEAA